MLFRSHELPEDELLFPLTAVGVDPDTVAGTVGTKFAVVVVWETAVPQSSRTRARMVVGRSIEGQREI